MDVDGCAGACCSGACLTGAKAGLAALLTLESLVCVAFGAWIGRRDKAMRLANSFAAGVFLAVAIVHILPHAAAGLSGAHIAAEHSTHPAPKQFPVANVVALAMLLAFVFVETVLLPGFSHGCQGHDESCNLYAPVDAECMQALHCGVARGDAHLDNIDRLGVATVDWHKYGSTGPTSASSAAEVESGGKTAVVDGEAGPRDAEAGHDGDGRFFSGAFAATTALMLAVSVHSFLESVSFGLTPTLSSAMTLFVAIAAHRWIVSTAVLARLMSAPGLRRTQRVALYLGFVLVLPIGVALGAVLSRVPGNVKSLFVGAAGGAFLYLGMEGVFAQMVSHGLWRLHKFISLLLGAVSIVTVEGVLFALNVSHAH